MGSLTLIYGQIKLFWTAMIFTDFVKRAYGSFAILGIRRHIKIDDNSISLMKLLSQIKRGASQFTYDFYLSIYPIDRNYAPWQYPTFTGISEDGKVVSEDIIQKDMDTLISSGKSIETFADRIIAHNDKSRSNIHITYGDIDNAVETFRKIANKYITVITSHGGDIEPRITYNWERIFTVPMIRKPEES